MLIFSGCTRLFGWDIHAPGILSNGFLQTIPQAEQRIALYLPESTFSYESKDKGSRFSDPQTYHVGESFAPMVLEAFQSSFNEFIYMETIPRKDILERYDIPYLVVLQIKGFDNTKDLRGQKLTVLTDVIVLDQDFNKLGRFESKGVSDAKKVFAKKGGPEVNLNAAIEKSIEGIILTLQDSFGSGRWSA